MRSLILLVAIGTAIFTLTGCDAISQGLALRAAHVPSDAYDRAGKVIITNTGSGFSTVTEFDEFGDQISERKIFTGTPSPLISNEAATRPAPGVGNGKIRRKAVNAATATYVSHLLAYAGGQLQRFNASTETVDLSKRLACTDPTETGLALDVSQDGGIAAVLTYTASTKKACLNIVDASTYNVLHQTVLPSPLLDVAAGVAISPDNQYAYTIADQPNASGQPAGSSLNQVDLSSGQIAATVSIPTIEGQARPNRLLMTPDGTTLFLYAADDVLIALTVVDVNTLSPSTFNVQLPSSQRLTDNFYQVHRFAMHPDGSRLYAITVQGGPVLSISTGDGSILAQTASIGGDSGGPYYLHPGGKGNPQFSQDGRLLFFLSSQTWISVLDTFTDTLIGQIPLAKNIDYDGTNTAGFFFVPAPPTVPQ